MKKLLRLTGVVEALSGVLLAALPEICIQYLFGAQLTGIAVPLARLVGITLFSLGTGCAFESLLLGMWSYTTLAALYLIYLGVASPFTGPLLWPGVAAHILLAILLPLSRKPHLSSSATPPLTREPLSPGKSAL